MDTLHLTWRYQNRLLAFLSERDLDHMMPLLTLHEVKLKEVLVAQGEQIHHIDFPCHCIYSSLVHLSDGNAIEVGTIGNEGMTGMAVMLDSRVSTSTLICQIPGIALRMSVDDFLWEFDHHPRLRFVTHLFAQAFVAQMQQSVACNRFHTLEQRTARWLLTTHDRTGQDEFPLTQEFLAIMLGAQRPTVSSVSQKLQDEGAIAYSRGRIRILQRTLLEAKCCECYAATRSHFERLLGVGAG